MFNCVNEDDRWFLESHPNVTCWDLRHICHLAVVVIILIFYLPLCYRMATVDGDLSKVAFYWWKTWKFDKSDTRNLHALSKREVIRIDCLIKDEMGKNELDIQV